MTSQLGLSMHRDTQERTPEDFQMSRTSTHGTYSVNYTHQSYPSNISSLEHHLWHRKAAEEDFWRASASGWHCKTSSMEGAAMQGPGGGTAAQTLHSECCTSPVDWIWASWGRCSLAGGSREAAGGQRDRHRDWQGGITKGFEVLQWCGVSPASRSENPSTWDRANLCPRGTEPIHVHMDNLLKGRSSSSASPGVLL